MSIQAPASVVMVRPHFFHPNTETAHDNAFQSQSSLSDRKIAAQAYYEATKLEEALNDAGIAVHLFEDDRDDRPDAVFPNNWFSTHAGGSAAIFPMHALNRRAERRADIIEFLKERYQLTFVADYSGYENDNRALEGTGAMVIDHANRVVYAASSQRIDRLLLERFCSDFCYEPFVFEAVDAQGVPIFHTNVLMCVGTEFALVGLELITSATSRSALLKRLEGAGRRVVPLTGRQVREFAGNAIELQGKGRKILAMSRRAHRSLQPSQLEIIEQSCDIVSVDIPTIELAGGSVRCMLAGVHLSPR